ncbi:MAG: polysaccharide deacetylase family protein [Rickettsiales bacterium]|nr:polysaccharide deacetylase family protein [Rickettsiales bacterium]
MVIFVRKAGPALIALALAGLFCCLGRRAKEVPRPAAGDSRVRRGWGEHGRGITDRIPGPAIYLTLDACDDRKDGFDAELVKFLISEEIPATVFLTGRWIDGNPEGAALLAGSGLFRIENHGASHLPASLGGKSAYGIRGTRSANELLAEVQGGADRIEALSGRRPAWFRSGAAHYDDGAADLIRSLGYEIAGFAVSLDAGASLSAGMVYGNAMKARPGDILLAHMNRPEKETFEGLAPALLELRRRGAKFAVLPD